MKIYINNKEFETEKNVNLSDFFSQIQENISGCAVAINENVIPKNRWQDTILHENDNIMLIKIACGG